MLLDATWMFDGRDAVAFVAMMRGKKEKRRSAMDSLVGSLSLTLGQH